MDVFWGGWDSIVLDLHLFAKVSKVALEALSSKLAESKRGVLLRGFVVAQNISDDKIAGWIPEQCAGQPLLGRFQNTVEGGVKAVVGHHLEHVSHIETERSRKWDDSLPAIMFYLEAGNTVGVQKREEAGIGVMMNPHDTMTFIQVLIYQRFFLLARPSDKLNRRNDVCSSNK